MPFLLIFGLCILVSLLLDRRSLMLAAIVPGIHYFATLGSEAFSVFFAGLFLLGVTFAWVWLRGRLLALLPAAIVAQLPRTTLAQFGQRPTRRHRELAPRRIGNRPLRRD